MNRLWTSNAYLASLVVFLALGSLNILEEFQIPVGAGAILLTGYFIVIAVNWRSARDRLAADTVERSRVLQPPQATTVARGLRFSAAGLAVVSAWLALDALL